MAKKTTIVLVDDHAVVRAGVRRLLEQEPLFEVIGEAESGEKAYQIFGELKPDVMVMIFKAYLSNYLHQVVLNQGILLTVLKFYQQ